MLQVGTESAGLGMDKLRRMQQQQQVLKMPLPQLLLLPLLGPGVPGVPRPAQPLLDEDLGPVLARVVTLLPSPVLLLLLARRLT